MAFHVPAARRELDLERGQATATVGTSIQGIQDEYKQREYETVTSIEVAKVVNLEAEDEPKSS